MIGMNAAAEFAYTRDCALARMQRAAREHHNRSKFCALWYCIYLPIRLIPKRGAGGCRANHEKIGKYEIIREIGKGATSAVYEALDPFVNRHVAMKVVFDEALGDKEHGRRYRKLFVTEASLAGKLSHPHIVSIYDAVADDEASYIVMEYVDGTTLEQYRAPRTCCRSTR